MNNYTVTKFNVTEKIGDSIFNRSMVTSGTMTITPKAGFVVSAVDFSISKLPSQLASVVFTDTATAGDINNKVTVTSTFANDFVVTGNLKIKLNIIGDAKVFKKEDQTISVGVRIIDNKNNNIFGSSTVSKFNNYILESTKEVGLNGVFDIFTDIITGSTTKNIVSKIGTITITADDDYFFNKKPYLKVSNDKNVYLKQLSTTKSDKYITSYTFDIMFSSDIDVYVNDQQPVFITYSAVKIPTKKNEITNVILSNTEVPYMGGDIKVDVYGNVDAEFDITITKSTDETYSVINPYGDSTTNIFTPAGTITGIRKKISRLNTDLNNMDNDNIISKYSFLQKFSMNTVAETALSSGISTTAMSVTSNSGVAIGDKVIMEKIPGGKTIKVTAINPSGANTLTVSESITADSGSTVKFVRNETYNLNVYPRNNTVLGPNMSITKPNVTIKQYNNPILKLVTTSSHGVNPGDVIYVGRANKLGYYLKNDQGAIGGTNTTITNYSNKNNFKITYTLAASSGNWRAVDATLPKWSSTDSTASSWTNSVYKDIVSRYGAATVAGNGGTHAEISNIAASGLSSSTLTLTMDVCVKQWGTDDVTMTLDLDPAFDAA
tara:strand:+ start:6906 stop:8723 length:1818 start_codon:yes stop_codon:yes gene_type:complete